jgi:transcriptional regulator with XRE-family HTH domain
MSIDTEKVKLVFGQNLAATRRARGLSQAELGERVNLSRVTIANIEGGKQNVQLGQLFSLASALNASPKELIPNPDQVQVGFQQFDELFLQLAKKNLSELAGGTK